MKRPIRIAIASGKGGTGKTTVAVNLAVTIAKTNTRTAYVDCDVEEPNGHIFLKPSIFKTTQVSATVPEVNKSKCTLCGACGTACRFSALAALPNTVLTFPKLCHSCGGCMLACAEGAITEVKRATGIVEEGISGNVAFVQGRLNIGESMAPPVIRAVLETASSDQVLILDAPPGTSCPVIAAVKTADVVVLVTEPTPFGLNDLKLAVAMVRKLQIPFGVVINRAGIGNSDVLDYCRNENIKVLTQIPNDRRIAEAYSRGELAAQVLPKTEILFAELFDKVVALRDDAQGQWTSRREADAVPLVMDDSPLLSDLEKEAFRETPNIPELVVLSGKGGTGKTGIAASFIALAQNGGAADCDVDAADLHLILKPTVKRRRPFSGGKRAVIDAERCTGCGLCAELCRFDAVTAPSADAASAYRIDTVSCEGCGVCADRCPEKAATLVSAVNGEWFVSDTRFGPMAHAGLGIAEENSGKLVSLVRKKGKEACADQHRGLMICDGSPGIGCPVISSMTGARMILIVTEPTLSGLHDMKRVAELARTMRIKAAVCVNKADINIEVAAKIEAEAEAWGIPCLGRVRYDDSVTAAQISGLSIVEHNDGPAAMDIRALWHCVQEEMNNE